MPLLYCLSPSNPHTSPNVAPHPSRDASENIVMKGADVEWADHSHEGDDVSTIGGPDKLLWTVVQSSCSLSVYQDLMFQKLHSLVVK